MEEQSPELQELLKHVDSFALKMKARLIQKSQQGYTGWKTEYTNEDVIHNIVMRLPRMLDEKDEVEVGIANWALINHLLKNRSNG